MKIESDNKTKFILTPLSFVGIGLYIQNEADITEYEIFNS